MTLSPSLHRWTLVALVLTAGVVSFAPMAQADGGWRRFKHDDRGRFDRGWSRPQSRVVFRERGHFGPGPVFAGVLGGLFLGAAISHAQPVIVQERDYAPAPCTRYEERTYAQPSQPYYPNDRSYEQPQQQNYRDDRTDVQPQSQQPRPQQQQQPTYRDDRSSTQPGASYRYEDGNGERWWDTLDECTDAARADHGPRVIRVIDAGNDRLVKTLFWKHDHWVSDQDRDAGDD